MLSKQSSNAEIHISGSRYRLANFRPWPRRHHPGRRKFLRASGAYHIISGTKPAKLLAVFVVDMAIAR
jgi:hypothetical protein